MDPRFAALYRRLHDEHWWFRARRDLVLRELRRLRADAPKGPILDIGCGDGLLLPDLEAFGRPEGLEPEAAIVSAATRDRWPIHLRPFDDDFRPERRYSLILLLDVLEHLDDPQGALAHVADLLDGGGSLLLTVPAGPSLWTRHDVLNEHRKRYRRPDLRSELGDAGLIVDHCEYFFHWLVPVKLLIRGIETLVPGEPRPPSLPPACANRLFRSFTLLEQQSWGRIGLPFGTSILAAAHRA